MAYKWIIKLVFVLIITQVFRIVDIFVIKKHFVHILGLRLMEVNINFINVYTPALTWMIEDILMLKVKNEGIENHHIKFDGAFNKTFTYFSEKEYIVKFDKLMIKDDTFNTFYQQIVFNNTCSVLTETQINCNNFSSVKMTLKNSYKKPFVNLLILFKFFSNLLEDHEKLNTALEDPSFLIYTYANIDSIIGYVK